VLLIFGVFATLSLVTRNDQDLGEYGDYPALPKVQNFCGKPGAVLAQGLQWTFGTVAICIPILAVLWGFDIIRWGRVKNAHIRVIGGLLFVLSTTSLANRWTAGGIVGMLVNKFVARFFPLPVVHLLALIALFLALLLLTELRLLDWIRILVRVAHRHAPGKETEEQPEEHPARETPPPQLADLFASPQAPELVASATPDPSAPALPQVTAEAPKAPLPDVPDKEQAAPEAEPVHAEYIPEPEFDDEEKDGPPPEAAQRQSDARPKSISPIFTRPDPSPKPAPSPRRPPRPYALPSVDLLERHISFDGSQQEHLIREKAAVLENTLNQFNIEAKVVEIQRGPVITQYELGLAPGIKVQKIISLADDIAMATKAPSVRIVAPIPGKSTVGIEVPNTHREIVRLRDVIETYFSAPRKHEIPILLGKDAAGVPLFSDLAQMPHLLIAGATGSGKSVCVNSIILSILMTKSPDEVKLLLVDPKMVELACFKDLPHLLSPVVTDMKRAATVLEWACMKMDERYALLSRTGVRNIAAFNQLGEAEIKRILTEGDAEAKVDDVPFSLPHLIIIVDELADLMMIASKEVEASITRLSQKSRAVGIHLILATQRPSVDVITGLIKANLPSRISFKVSSKIDSGVILDQRGAEKLLGMGDMLFLPPGTSRLVRAQGTFVSDGEINAICGSVRKLRDPEYDMQLAQYRVAAQKSPEERDILYPEAVRIVLQHERGSVSLLQRRLEIGYSRAARLIDMMADDGIVGEYKGSQARDILISLEEWERLYEDQSNGNQ